MMAATPASSNRAPGRRRRVGGFGPALDRDLAVARRRCRPRSGRETARRPAHQLRIAQRRVPRMTRVTPAQPSPRSAPGRGCRRRAAPAFVAAAQDGADRGAVDGSRRRRRRSGRRRAATETLVARPRLRGRVLGVDGGRSPSSPRFRRTHWPSFRSMAGKRIISDGYPQKERMPNSGQLRKSETRTGSIPKILESSSKKPG